MQMFPGARFPPQFAGFPPPGPPFFHPDPRYDITDLYMIVLIGTNCIFCIVIFNAILRVLDLKCKRITIESEYDSSFDHMNGCVNLYLLITEFLFNARKPTNVSLIHCM